MANEIVGRALIKIIPDSGGFSATLQKQLNGATKGAAGGLMGVNTGLKQMSHNMEIAAKRGILVGQAFTYGVSRPLIETGVAIAGVAIEYDKAVRTIAAITVPSMDETSADFEKRVDQYSESARRMSKDTVFSAQEVGEAYVDLARAGLTSAEQLESVIGTVANVALVEGGKMADFSDSLVQIFTGFGGSFSEFGADVKTIFGEARLGPEELTKEFERMGDVLALTSQRTTTDITGLANAFRYAGPTAAAAGVSFNETSAALGALAQAGFEGTLGGTALRGIITRLAVPTKINEKLFTKFGLSVDQAFAPENAEKLTEAMRELGATEEEMTEFREEGAESMKKHANMMKNGGLEIFNQKGEMIDLVDIVKKFSAEGARVGDVMKLMGQRAGPAFQSLMNNIPLLENLTTELDHAEGALGKMAEGMKSSASAQLQMFKNSLIEVAIVMGESGLLDKLVKVAQGLREITYSLLESNPRLITMAAGIAAVVAAVGPLMMIGNFWALGWAKFLHLASSPIGLFVIALGGIAVAFAKIYESSYALQAALRDLFAAFEPILEWFGVLVSSIFPAFSSGVDSIGKSIGDNLAGYIRNLRQEIDSWVHGGGLKELTELVARWMQSVKDFASEAGERLASLFDSIKNIATSILPLLQGVARAFAETVAPTLIETLATAFMGLAGAIVFLVDALEGLLVFLKPLFSFLGDEGASDIIATLGAFLLFRSVIGRFTQTLRPANDEMQRLNKTNFNNINTNLKNLGGTLNGPSSPFNILTSGKQSNIQKTITNLDKVGSAVTRMSGPLRALNPAGIDLATGAVGRLGGGISKMAGGLERARVGLKSLHNSWVNVEEKGVKALGALEAGMAGLFAGKMLAKAETLTDKITGIGVAAGGALSAFALVGGGPIGWAMIGITAITTAVGIFSEKLGKTKIDAEKAFSGFREVFGDNRVQDNLTQTIDLLDELFAEFKNDEGLAGLKVYMEDIAKATGDADINIESFARSLARIPNAPTPDQWFDDFVNTLTEDQIQEKMDTSRVPAIPGAVARSYEYASIEEYTRKFNENPDAIRQKERALVLTREEVAALQETITANKGAFDSEKALYDLRIAGEAFSIGMTKAEYEHSMAIQESTRVLGEYQSALWALVNDPIDFSGFQDTLFTNLRSGWEKFNKDFSPEMLEGMSQFAVDNRKFIEGIGQDYFSTVSSLASTDLSLEEFTVQLQKFREDFVWVLINEGGFSPEEAALISQEMDKNLVKAYGSMDPQAIWNDATAVRDTAIAAAAEGSKLTPEQLNSPMQDPYSAVNREVKPWDDLARAGAAAKAKRRAAGLLEVEDNAKKFFEAAARIEREKAEEESRKAFGEAFKFGKKKTEGMAEGASLGAESAFKAAPASMGQSFVGRALGLAVGGGDPKNAGKAEATLAAVNTVGTFRSKVDELLGSGVGSAVGKFIGGSGEGGNNIGVNVQIRGLDIAMSVVQNFLSIASLGFQAFGNVITSTFNLATLAIVGFTNRLASIPGAMRGIAYAIASAFAAPINFAANSVWGPFAILINAAAAAFGIKASLPTGAKIPSVPAFHTGGVVGNGAPGRRSLSDQRGDEIVAMLKKGEGVLPADVMAKMTRADFEALRTGNMDATHFNNRDQIGGPYESGRAAGTASGAAGAYFPTGMAQMAYSSMSGIFSTMMANPNVMAKVVGAAMRQVGDGFMEWINGAGEAASEAIRNQTGSWPVGYSFPGGPRDGDLSKEIAAVQSRMGQENSFPAILEFLEATGVPFRVTSTLRNSIINGTNKPSLHNVGRAVDLAEVGGYSEDSPGLLAIYQALGPIAGFVRRIYSGPGGNGSVLDWFTNNDHHDHVHVSLARGGIIRGRTRALLGEVGDEVVIPLNDPRRAMSLALNSGLFNLLSRASGPTSSAAVPGLPSATSRGTSQPGPGDPGFLGGGPGNTYNIYGVGLDQVKAEVRARDEADMRKVRR